MGKSKTHQQVLGFLFHRLQSVNNILHPKAPIYKFRVIRLICEIRVQNSCLYFELRQNAVDKPVRVERLQVVRLLTQPGKQDRQTEIAVDGERHPAARR